MASPQLLSVGHGDPGSPRRDGKPAHALILDQLPTNLCVLTRLRTNRAKPLVTESRRLSGPASGRRRRSKIYIKSINEPSMFVQHTSLTVGRAGLKQPPQTEDQKRSKPCRNAVLVLEILVMKTNIHFS